jgi:hypothetical protein
MSLIKKSFCVGWLHFAGNFEFYREFLGFELKMFRKTRGQAEEKLNLLFTIYDLAGFVYLFS